MQFQEITENLLVTVIHVVVDWVKTGQAGAGVPACHAAAGRARLRRCVTDKVALSVAIISFKGMDEAAPVADFMCSNLASTESSRRSSGLHTTRRRPCADDTAVIGNGT